MTRRRIIAGVILLAAVVVAVPFVPGVWEKVVYRHELRLDHRPVVRTKLWEWLPGRPSYMPDQVCSICFRGAHDTCWRVYDNRARPGGLRCTCTDPSHDD